MYPEGYGVPSERRHLGLSGCTQVHPTSIKIILITARKTRPMNDFLESPMARRLIKAGLMDAETGATRRARAVACPSCRRGVMRGIDRAFGGKVVMAEPTPLSNLGEALALMAGRVTVELRWLGDRYEIDRRDHFRIRGSPAETHGIDILVVHECELSTGPPLPHTDSTLSDDIRPVPLPDNPPF